MFHIYEFKTQEISYQKTASMCKLRDITTLRKRRIRGEKIRKSMQYVCKEYSLLHTHTTLCFESSAERTLPEGMHAVAPMTDHKHSLQLD